SVPCTCFSQTGAEGRRRPSLARAVSLLASPISRVVTNARTPGGAGQSGERISGRAGTAKEIQQAAEILGQRRFPLPRPAGARMHEFEAGGVQRLALEPFQNLRFRSPAVDRVAHQRMADRLEVNADLVGAPA